jgi:hypothetical protein
VIPSFQFFQILIVDQTSLPQILKEGEVWSTGAHGLAAVVMEAFYMFHSVVPRSPPILERVLKLVAQGALYSPWGLLAAKVALAVRLPLFRVP